MWDPVPWLVGGGARHSTNVARNVAFAAFGGREGIVNPADLEVRELSAPGASVRVFPGTVAIKNRALNSEDEMYVGRLPSEDTVAIPPTDSLSARSDLVVARVENPHIPTESWDQPDDPATGPYIFTRVISDVDPNTTSVEDLGLGYSAIALARIDLPVSTSVVQQAHITDLRKLSQSQLFTDFNLVAPTELQDLTSDTYVNWPRQGSFDAVEVPEWATHARVRALIAGVGYGAPGDNGGAGWNAVGTLRVQLGGDTYSQATAYNVSTPSGTDRAVLMAGAARMPVKKALRGTTTWLRVEGLKSIGNSNIYTDERSLVSIDVTFYSAVESNV